jgi:hypothetical protein
MKFAKLMMGIISRQQLWWMIEEPISSMKQPGEIGAFRLPGDLRGVFGKEVRIIGLEVDGEMGWTFDRPPFSPLQGCSAISFQSGGQ